MPDHRKPGTRKGPPLRVRQPTPFAEQKLEDELRVEEMINKRNAEKDMGVVELLGWKQKGRRMNRNGVGVVRVILFQQ